MFYTSIVREDHNGTLLLELSVCYEKTTDAHGEPAARIVRVDDDLRGYDDVGEDLPKEQRKMIREEIGLSLLWEPAEWKERPRYRRDEEGNYHRVAYRRWARRDWIGGKGYVYFDVVTVWSPERGTLEEAGEDAEPGEQFALVLTESGFVRKTYPPQDLPPVGREEARKQITSAARKRPGKALTCRFVKRTTGELRTMRFRYDPQKVARNKANAGFQFDPKAKGLLSVYDVEKGAQRFINLDGVRTVSKQYAGHGPAPGRRMQQR